MDTQSDERHLLINTHSTEQDERFTTERDSSDIFDSVSTVSLQNAFELGPVNISHQIPVIGRSIALFAHPYPSTSISA